MFPCFIGMTAGALAERLHVPKNRLYQIIKGECAVTADIALRLGKFFGAGADIWLNLQKSCELDVATRKMKGEIERIPAYTPGTIGSAPTPLSV